MNNPKFYIFGVPDGFNILSGTEEEILYYQLFYNTTKSGVEMRINRKPNGETVYSYLIYNLVSSKGREGAFFGMSLVFTGNEYCNNPAKLRELFDGVYQEVILKADENDKIIIPISGSNAVGRFCISKFEERRNMCEKIGRIIIQNVIGEMSNSIGRIDGSFDNSKEGRVVTLPLTADGVRIVQAIHGYLWVSLSSECVEKVGEAKKPPIELIDVHFVKELENKETKYQEFIIKGYEGKYAAHNVSAKITEINSHLDLLEKYVGRQPELRQIRDKYSSIYNQLCALRDKMGDPTPSHDPTSSPDPNPGVSEWLKKNVSKVVAAVVVLVVLGCALKFIPWSEEDKEGGEVENPEKTGDDEIIKFDEKKFMELLESADYATAWSMLDAVKDEAIKVSNARKLQSSYRDWFKQQRETLKNNKQGLTDLREKITKWTFIDNFQADVKQLEEDINQIPNPKPVPDQKNPSSPTNNVVHIYNATDDKMEFTKGNMITVKDKTIVCKKGDCFIVEGATNKPKSSDNEKLQVASRNDGNYQLKAGAIGSFTLTINQVEYKFNVKNK